MMLTPHGIREWLGLTIIIAAVAIPLGLFINWWWTIPFILLWLAVLSFFRDPIRSLPRNLKPGDMLSPGDGTVSAVLHVDNHEAVNGPAVIVRIFLSLLNVHVNRSPCDGEVVALRYQKGAFHDARSEESARENENNLIIMIKPDNEAIGVRQVSGKVARRIVCPLHAGDRLARGQKFGMIKFGSTAELILPRPNDVTVHVKKGDKVKAGLTILATLPPYEGDEYDAPPQRDNSGAVV